MKAVEILINEHRLIRQYLENLEMVIQKLETGIDPPRVFFGKAIFFGQQFVDKYHHFKEEFQMFRILAQKHNGSIDAPIEALRSQHEQGRNYIANISAILEREEIQKPDLIENLRAYNSMLRQHIHREDHVFYPLAEKNLSEAEQAQLLEEFRKADANAEENFFEKTERLVREMGELALAL